MFWGLLFEMIFKERSKVMGKEVSLFGAQVGNCHDPPILEHRAQFGKGNEIIYKKALETVLLWMAH